MNTREKIQFSALSGAKLELTHDEVRRVYDVIGWASRFLAGHDDDHTGRAVLWALTNCE